MTKPPTSTSQPPGPMPASEPAGAILNVAEQLAQSRGYNGFSYADIATRLGVTKASLHYHFPSKAELGRALITRYQAAFGAALEAIDRRGLAAPEKLREYVALYDSVMRNDRICLCGMLAAEYATLPAPMQEALRRFFEMNERWLTAVLLDGRRAGSLLFAASANRRARLILGALEGAMLVARSFGDFARFHAAADQVLDDLAARRKSR